MFDFWQVHYGIPCSTAHRTLLLTAHLQALTAHHPVLRVPLAHLALAGVPGVEMQQQLGAPQLSGVGLLVQQQEEGDLHGA